MFTLLLIVTVILVIYTVIPGIIKWAITTLKQIVDFTKNSFNDKKATVLEGETVEKKTDVSQPTFALTEDALLAMLVFLSTEQAKTIIIQSDVLSDAVSKLSDITTVKTATTKKSTTRRK